MAAPQPTVANIIVYFSVAGGQNGGRDFYFDDCQSIFDAVAVLRN